LARRTSFFHLLWEERIHELKWEDLGLGGIRNGIEEEEGWLEEGSYSFIAL